MFKKHKDITSLVNELSELLAKNNLSEIEYERNGSRIRISNAKGGAIIAGGVAPVASAPVSANTTTANAPASVDLSNAFKSPMVVVVYM